ncbi:MAG: DUF3313 domain-containing protein [Myxococcales bacterium]|nr:DUF3313 domain-containing protein [Myxococcales bacterium]
MFHDSVSRTTRFLCVLGLLGLALAVAACATTRQSRGSGSQSGFLGDYSDLREGEGDEPQLIYINSSANWSQYDAIHIDSVTLWRDAKTEDVSEEDQQRLTDYLYQELHEQLSQDYRMAERPGPGVLRLRAAITEAKGASVVMNTVTSVVPQLRLATTIVGMAAGTSVLVGKVGVEGELTDSLTGARLGAFVDERQGTKALRGGIKKWSDLERAFDFWAERLRNRLATLRGA